MCTQPIKILNPSKRLAPDRGQQLWLYVPCGHCAECRQQKQNEWRVRSYFEMVRCIESSPDSYALFDTLTYSDRYVPHVSDFEDVSSGVDFMCFRRSDVQNFFKRLRTNLFRLGYDPKDRLRYFLTSEYGTHGTLRPHYHVIFFVRDGFVPNLVLSEQISKAWSVTNGLPSGHPDYTSSPIGRTDGLPYRSSSYVNFHNTFRSVDLSQKKVVLYVAKYVAKDFLYSKTVVDRLSKLMYAKFPDFDWKMSVEQREYYKWLCRFVSPFHNQSIDFGNAYINYQGGRRSIIDRRFLKFNFDGLPLTFSLFPSLKRKLFYNRNKINGDTNWFLNNEGILFKSKSVVNQINNLKTDVENYNLNHSDNLSFDPSKFVLFHYRLQDPSAATLSNFKKTLVLSSSCDQFNSLRNYCSFDRSFIHKSVLTKNDYGSKKHGFSVCHKLRQVYSVSDLDSETFISLSDFEKNYMCYDPQIEAEISKLLQWKKEQGIKKLELLKLNERVKRKLKQLSLC